MKVYTKGGDKGKTSLIGGERVKKYDIRVEAYGTVDELSAHLALLGDEMRGDAALQGFEQDIAKINSMLMNVEAHLAAGEKVEFALPEVSEDSITYLEKAIDLMHSDLPQLTKFTIPGGCRLNSLAHVCRTVCRRAERRVVEVGETYPLNENISIYLNRLSDYLYLLGRTMSAHCGVEEQLWQA